MYDECLFYINNLVIPDGFSVETFAITDAISMTSGYQYAMKQSDAKYKIYLHQDVFITNQHFIIDLIDIFNSNEKIGLVGMIGTTNLLEDNLAITSWNVGAIYHNCTPKKLIFATDSLQKYSEVEAVDGCIICTQADLNWREDIFDGWDFYDISQCLEMKRNNFICAVPTQSRPWVYHNNTYSKMTNYYHYQNKFACEYQDIKPFKQIVPSAQKVSFDNLKENSRNQIKAIIDRGEKDSLITLFSDPNSCGYLHLRDFEIISQIAKYQRHTNNELFWSNDSFDELHGKLQQIRFALTRNHFNFENNLPEFSLLYGEEIIALIKSYSL